MNFAAGSRATKAAARRGAICGGVSGEAAAIAAILGQVLYLVVIDPGGAQWNAQSAKTHRTSTKLLLADASHG